MFAETLEYIDATWPSLTKNALGARRDATLIVDPNENIFLPEPYIVPGGRFDTMFYWDSYFTMLGLRHDPSHRPLMLGMVTNCVYMVEQFGRVLNSNKKIWSTRSQLPYLTSMIELCRPFAEDDAWLERCYDAAILEYEGYWTTGNHVFDNGLSRFFEDSGDNYMTRHTEASWDMSPRFNDDDTTSLAPVDLNANLFVYEEHLSAEMERRTNPGEAERYRRLASDRRSTMHDLMWDHESKMFYDYNVDRQRRTNIASLATFVPMWAGMVDEATAEQIASTLPRFERAHGLATCDHDYGYVDRQWNHPFGWAPLHSMVCTGLRRYEFFDAAARIARAWCELNAQVFHDTGTMWEKYDVVSGTVAEVHDRYANQVGFGWTNGVFVDLVNDVLHDASESSQPNR